MEQDHKELGDLVDEFVTNFESSVNKLESSHIKERIEINRKGGKAITDFSPELQVFDKSVAAENKRKNSDDDGYDLNSLGDMLADGNSSRRSSITNSDEIYYRY